MKKIPFGKPITGQEEKDAICAVMDTGMLAHGNRITEFETEFARFTDSPVAVGVSSCTAALHLCYFYMGLGAGDEVIVPAQTHTATAHAVELTSAKAVFVDAEAETGNIDTNLIEAAITENTKAISVVHFLGMPVDMHAVCRIARKYELQVVEDCALSVGARLDGEHTGLMGDFGCFSFYPVKHITSAEGGMLISSDPEKGEAIRKMRAFNMDRNLGERTQPGLYDMVGLGFNYRLNEVQAAIGIEQMKRLPGFLELRKRNYEALSKGLQEIDEVSIFQSSHDGFESSYYCHSMILNDDIAEKRFDIVGELKKAGIGTSIYYPEPVPKMTYYKEKYNVGEDEFPVATKISHNSIALPCGPHVELEDVDYIVEQIKAAIAKVK